MPKTLMEAKMTKLKLSYFRHIPRRSYGKDNNDGKNRRQEEKRKTNMRRIDSIKKPQA